MFTRIFLQEREEFKRNIRSDLARNQIETYPMAKFDHEEDFEVNQSYRVCDKKDTFLRSALISFQN